MCGIVGFNGIEQAAPILLDGLSKLEYRGYDSAGIAVRNGSNPVEVIKAKGRLAGLKAKTNEGKALLGSCGIGHTRWATHGEPSEINAHPHRSDDDNVIAVHNGIIENYQELKDKLLRNGRTGRLLVNLELMKAGYPPIDIKFTDRIAYYNAFDEYHVKHNLGGMEKLFAGYVNERLDSYLFMLEK
jgi:glutamine phosphoribosylpyrophosphate amidotransferase